MDLIISILEPVLGIFGPVGDIGIGLLDRIAAHEGGPILGILSLLGIGR